MRVTGGRFAGRHLKIPKGPPIRPTLDHVRQAIFNILGSRVTGARVLDLFSGSGALGIEALSRGAAHGIFVDRSFFCVQAIQQNLEALSLTTLHPSPFTLHRCEATTAIRRLRREGITVDLVFLDPPYGKRLARISLNALIEYDIVGPSGWVLAEHDKRDSLPPVVSDTTREGVRMVLQRRMRYGDTALTIYEKQ